MGFGRRILQTFSSGEAPEEDPGAIMEAGVVRLPEGPMLVERLAQRGIQASGIESVDPVTEIRSNMRIMVRQADLAAARQVLSETKAQPVDPGALDDLVAVELDEESAAAEEASQHAMGLLFVAADRLAGRPGDLALVAEVEDLGAIVTENRPPFGVEPLAWARVASLADAVLAAGAAEEGDDEEGVLIAATALRDFLREYV